MLELSRLNLEVQELRDHRSRLESLVLERTHGLRDSQRRLEQTTAYLQAAYESITDGILVAEWPTGRVVAANRKFMSFFGLEPDHLRDRTCHDVAQAMRNSPLGRLVTDDEATCSALVS